eukprot:1923105-Rhodomonas_salina.3
MLSHSLLGRRRGRLSRGRWGASRLRLSRAIASKYTPSHCDSTVPGPCFTLLFSTACNDPLISLTWIAGARSDLLQSDARGGWLCSFRVRV